MKPSVKPPTHVAWETTRQATSHPRHRQLPPISQDGLTGELETLEALKAIEELSAAGVKMLSLQGGEPLTRPDIFKLVRHARERGLSTNLCTDGYLITAGVSMRLKEAGAFSVTVHLDGAQARTHDALWQHPGLFDRAINAIRILVKGEHRVNISFMPTGENYREAAAAIELACELGADLFCMSCHIPTGAQGSELQLSPDRLAAIADLALAMHDHYTRRIQVRWHDCRVELERPPEQRQSYSGCGAGRATAGIRSDGTLTPCILMPNPAGNLRELPFEMIWNQANVLAQMRDRTLLREGNCGVCVFKSVCGGCRAMAMACHGDPLLGDPTCWLYPDPGNAPSAVSAAA